MKKIMLYFLTAVLLFASGCGQNGSSSVDDGAPNDWGITFSVENVSNFGMTLVCTQSGGKARGELQTGAQFVVERFVEGDWLPVSTVPGLDVAWTMEAWNIAPNAVSKWKVDWEWLYGYLDPGTYRMSKVVRDFRGPGKYTEKTYYVEFGIAD